MSPEQDAVRRLANRQDSVVTVAQCLRLGVTESWVQRRVSSGRWQRLHRGVLVVHSGPVLWRSRARAGLLYAGSGALLSHRSAAFLHEFEPTVPRLIEVVVPEHRRVAPTGGLVIRRRRTQAGAPAGRTPIVLAQGRMPVVNAADTVLDLLDQVTSTDDAVGLLCRAVRARVDPDHILTSVSRRRRVRHRQLVLDLLSAVVSGVESPLEHRYDRDVERRHGLPRSRLQHRHLLAARWVRADRLFEEYLVRVELDGEIAHPGGRTDADVWRDNAALVERAELTLRYRWRHVATTPCRSTLQVAAALRARGWTGHPHPCGPTCPVPPPPGHPPNTPQPTRPSR